jgi:hypothetical protein
MNGGVNREFHPQGITSHPGDKIHPWGTTSPLGSKCAPTGEAKNGPLVLLTYIPRCAGVCERILIFFWPFARMEGFIACPDRLPTGTDTDIGRRVARWYKFKPKISIWVNFWRIWNERCWYISWSFGIFYGHLLYFVAILVLFIVIWYIFTHFKYVVPRKIWQPWLDVCKRRQLPRRKREKPCQNRGCQIFLCYNIGNTTQGNK